MKLGIWREVFREAARKLEFAEVELDEKGSCTLVPQQNGVQPIHIVFDDESGIVDVYSEIGIVPDADAGVYRELLSDNLFAEKTKGATYAASRTTGGIVLQRTFEVRDAGDGEAFAVLLADFAEVAAAGRRLIYRSVLGEAPKPRRSGEAESDGAGFMRV